MEQPKNNQVPFIIKEYWDEDNWLRKGIFIDNELFDWGIDEDSFKEAMSMGPEYFNVFKADIERHFIESISEFMNRKVTAAEVNEATKTGWIDK